MLLAKAKGKTWISVDLNRESRNKAAQICPSDLFVKVQKQFNAESITYHRSYRNNSLSKEQNNKPWPMSELHTSYGAHSIRVTNLNLNIKKAKLLEKYRKKYEI